MDESFGNMKSEKEGRMRPEIIFMPLGGGQRVGASCYYLKIGDRNILLDEVIGLERIRGWNLSRIFIVCLPLHLCNLWGRSIRFLYPMLIWIM